MLCDAAFGVAPRRFTGGYEFGFRVLEGLGMLRESIHDGYLLTPYLRELFADAYDKHRANRVKQQDK
jgi:hypothetical protein